MIVPKTVGRATCQMQSTLEFEWRVDFSSHYVANTNANVFECLLLSPPLHLSKGSTVELMMGDWRLFLYSMSTSLISGISMIAGLFKDRNENCGEIECNISLLDGNRQVFDGATVLDSEHTQKLREILGEQYHFAGMMIFIDCDQLNDTSRLLASDTLIVSCKISKINSCVPLLGPQNLHDDFENLFELLDLRPELSDVTFRFGEKELRANKAILSVRSKVFQAMFTHNMREKNENVIPIPDVSYDVMKELIRFIYCEKVDNLNEIIFDLVIAADKYDVPALKSICEITLSKSLSLANICQIFMVATISDCRQLKAKAIEFIQNNLRAVIETPAFKHLEKSNPPLVVDMITCAVTVVRN